ncbi:MAG: hypothetical protein KBA61_09210 [Spirochaetes bacterium]|nr:hypothetical protein [Spirochaetota bacterium]
MKKILFVMMTLVFAGLVACSSDEAKQLNQEEAFAVFGTAMTSAMEASEAAVDAATTSGGSGSMMSIAPGEPSLATTVYSLDWWNDPLHTVHVTGNLDYTDSPLNYDYTATVAFSNFVCDDGTIINGSSTDDFNGDDITFTSHIFGDLDITYRGDDYDFSWDFTFSCNAETCTFGGSFTVGGQTYPLEGMEE